MVAIAEWAEQWLGERWRAIPVAEGGWTIVLYDDSRRLASTTRLASHIGLFEDEEEARHVARAHNYYLAGLRDEIAREELDAGSEPSEP